jgi:hypothetical protein
VIQSVLTENLDGQATVGRSSRSFWYEALHPQLHVVGKAEVLEVPQVLVLVGGQRQAADAVAEAHARHAHVQRCSGEHRALLVGQVEDEALVRAALNLVVRKGEASIDHGHRVLSVVLLELCSEVGAGVRR